MHLQGDENLPSQGSAQSLNPGCGRSVVHGCDSRIDPLPLRWHNGKGMGTSLSVLVACGSSAKATARNSLLQLPRPTLTGYQYQSSQQRLDACRTTARFARRPGGDARAGPQV